MQQSHNHLFPERHRRNPEFEEGVLARKYEISPAVADVMNLVRRIDSLLARDGDNFVASVEQRDANPQAAPAQAGTAESADVPTIDPAIVAGAVVNASMEGREPELFSEDFSPDAMQDPNYLGGIALEGSESEQL